MNQLAQSIRDLYVRMQTERERALPDLERHFTTDI